MNFILNFFNKKEVPFPYGTGAIKQLPDSSIVNKETIAGDSQPFDWNIGYDIRDTLFHKCGINQIPVKDQGQSSSCGGQATSYLMGVLDALNDKIYIEKSARFIYAPVHVQGGGSSESALMSRILNIGSASEQLVCSYEANLLPSEEFMEKTDDIGSNDLQNALSAKGMIPVYLDPTDIDKLAQAIRDNGGFVMGVHGQNDGTWLSAYPKVPTTSVNKCWAHWLYFFSAKLINGKKYLGFINSWGQIGENNTGVQWIPEEYLAKYTWGAWTTILVNPPKVTYTFNNTLSLGTSSVDVQKLQIVLKNLGFFPQAQAITNYFGSISCNAVKEFQKANNLPITGVCGNLTRQQLNKLTQ